NCCCSSVNPNSTPPSFPLSVFPIFKLNTIYNTGPGTSPSQVPRLDSSDTLRPCVGVIFSRCLLPLSAAFSSILSTARLLSSPHSTSRFESPFGSLHTPRLSLLPQWQRASSLPTIQVLVHPRRGWPSLLTASSPVPMAAIVFATRSPR